MTPNPDAEALYRALLESVQRSIAAVAAPTRLAIVGIRTGGVWVAQRLHADLGIDADQGILTSAFHRDDHGTRGIPTTIGASQIDFAVDDRHIVLVDDILYTGRTVRAALNEIFDYGRPRRVELAVLVDRGGRELPLQPDHVGGRLDLGADERLVLSQETSGRLALRVELGDG